MNSLSDFLIRAGLENQKLINYFSEVDIDNISLSKKTNRCKIFISSKKFLSTEKVEGLSGELNRLLCPPMDKVTILPKIVGLEKKKDIKKVIQQFWGNIFYLIKKECPSVLAYDQEIEHMVLEKKLEDTESTQEKNIEVSLYIKLPSEFIYERFKNRKLEEKIYNLILEQLGLDLKIVLEVAKQNKNKDSEIEKIIEKQEKETLKILSRIEFKAEVDQKAEQDDKYVVKSEKDPNIIYGENVDAFYNEIKEIKDTQHTVGVVGEVFEAELIEFKNGKSMYKMYITDTTGAILGKVYLNDMNKDQVINGAKVGSYVRVKGDVHKNKDWDIELNVTGIKKEKKPVKMDKAKEKRVELHAHTQLSAMDSVVPVKELVKTAISWGHKAIAITDHSVVQAFPDAMNAAAKEKDFKIIYGVEANLVDDNQEIIKNANDLDFNQPFVVFDIETTGFSARNDNITEIGALRYEDGRVVGEFSEFVNPKMDIPYVVQELTGITNEMVEDKDGIDIVLEKFIEFAKGAILVAHNADFDTGFIKQKCSENNIEYSFEQVDTLTLAKVLVPEVKAYNLGRLCKYFNIDLTNAHRAIHDARGTLRLFEKLLERAEKKGATTLLEINKVLGKLDYRKIRPTHATIYALNQAGLKNLYKIISDSHTEHLEKSPLVLKSVLQKYREGLLVGSACSNGEVFSAILKNKGEDEIAPLMDFYDFLEIMPVSNNIDLIVDGGVKDYDEIRMINKKIVELGEKYDKIVVATGDVHTMDKYQGIYRLILKYSETHSEKMKNKLALEDLHFRTTEEMLEEFEYLGEEKAFEVVVSNTNLIAGMFDKILPIPNETYPPKIEGSEDDLKLMCYQKAEKIYGSPLPKIVYRRLNRELTSIISNGYAVMYIIANKLVAKSLSDGYLVGSRGSVGSSFAATMSDITEVNPLPAHYICPNEKCKHSEFFSIGEYGSGIDLADKDCPKCGTRMIKEGNDIPFEVFLGFEGDKEPDIDLNFSGVYQPEIHAYTDAYFGEGYTYRAGTIGTVKDKTSYGYVKKYIDEKEIDASQADIKWLTHGCTGVKKTSGQHPGGVMVIPHDMNVHDFTPIQYPANDKTSGVKTTHFDYHSISGRILKLDILGHDGPTIIKMLEDMTGITITDIPLDDQETMSLFTSTKALGVTEEEIGTPVGSLAIPEFGTKFTRQMLIDTKPTTFAELVRISGLSHGTDVWVNNAQDLVRSNVVGLKDVISTRDDIMNYLIFKGLEPKLAFTIMESVRKGRGLTPEFEKAMNEKEVPEWYISSCKKIKYMFPKAHAVAYVMTSFRIAYCKVNYPEAFYSTYFTTKVDDIDIELVIQGKEAVFRRMREIEAKGMEITAKEKVQYTILEVVIEMLARGIEFEKIDIYKSEAKEFKPSGPKRILPPLASLSGLGEQIAENIVKERVNGEFISKEDLVKRCSVQKGTIEKLTKLGSLENMSDKNQLSFF